MNPQVPPLFTAALAAALLPAASGRAQNLPASVLAGPSNVKIMPGSVMPSTLPFELWNGVIVVPVIVGEGVITPAALNTGLPLSMVSPQVAQRQGLKPNGSRQIEVMDRKITVASAYPQTVRLDRMALVGVPFGVGDLMGLLSSKTDEDAPSIWLGSSALEALCLTIDPRKQEIVVRPAHASIPGRVTRIPFALRDGRIWVDVKAKNQKFEALIDTGSAATLLPAKLVGSLQLKPDTVFEMVDRNGKPGKVGIGKLAELSLGKLSAKDVSVLFVTEGDPNGISPDFAVIGNDFLFRHRVSIDYGRKEIAFEVLPPLESKENVNKEPAKEKKDEPKKEPAGGKDTKKEPPRADPGAVSPGRKMSPASWGYVRFR